MRRNSHGVHPAALPHLDLPESRRPSHVSSDWADDAITPSGLLKGKTGPARPRIETASRQTHSSRCTVRRNPSADHRVLHNSQEKHHSSGCAASGIHRDDTRRVGPPARTKRGDLNRDGLHQGSANRHARHPALSALTAVGGCQYGVGVWDLETPNRSTVNYRAALCDGQPQRLLALLGGAIRNSSTSTSPQHHFPSSKWSPLISHVFYASFYDLHHHRGSRARPIRRPTLAGQTAN